MAEQDQIHVDDFTPDPPQSQSAPDLSRYEKYKVTTESKPAQVASPITKTSTPPVPKPPLPWELRTDTQKHQAEVERKQKLAAGVKPDVKPLTPYQGFQAATNIPVIGGVVQAGEGLTEALKATSGPEAAKGITKAIGGGLDAVLPLAGESILAKPAEAAVAGVAGWATQEATQEGLKKLGIKPEYADLAGSVTGLLSAYAAGKIRLSPEQTTLVETLQGKEVPDQVAKLQKLASDPGTTQGERDAATAMLKKKFNIDHPAFKPAEPYPTPPTAPAQQPLPLKPEAAPPEVPAPVEKSLNGDVEQTPVRGTYPPQPEPAEQVPPTPEAEKRPAEPERLWQKGDPIPDYGQVVNIDPKLLVPKPAIYQYKNEAVGKGGTTSEFYDVKEWNPGLGGAMAVWVDPQGDVVPINGHHRTELAQRTNPPSVNVRFIPAKTPEEARTFGAMLNIGEGKGTSIDAAKLFRDAKVTPADLAKYNIAPTSKLAVQGMGLSKLDPSIFKQVVDEKMTATRGALIGDLLEGNFEAQKAAVDFFKKQDKSGTRYTNAEASDIIQSIKATPDYVDTPDEDQGVLWGADEIKKNLFGERGQVSAAIGKRLGKEKSLFNLVSKEAVAQKLSGAGNILNSEENAKISQEAAQVLAVYDKLKFSAGPVSDALNDAAKEVASGTDIDIATDKAYERIKEAVSGELSGKPVTKPGVSGPNAVESGKADQSGSGSGVEVDEVAPPKEEDLTPDPVTKPVELEPKSPEDKEEFEPEPEPKKPEAPAHPVGTILKDQNSNAYVKVLTSDPEKLHVVGINPSTGNPWISPNKYDIPAKEFNLWNPAILPPPNQKLSQAGTPKGWDSTATPAPPMKPLSPADMQDATYQSGGGDWLEDWFKPGNVIYNDYWGDHDKVLKYEPNAGAWQVQVIKSDKEGNPVYGEKPRWHSTFPDNKNRVVKYDPSILVKKTAPPAPKSPVAGAPTKEPPTLKGYKKKTSVPDKYTDNEKEKTTLFGSSYKYDLDNVIVQTKVEVMNLLAPAVEHLKIPKALKGLFFEGGLGNINDHQKVVAGLVNAWAGTSADNDKNSLALQIAVQAEFGLALDWDFKKVNSAYEDSLNEAYNIYGQSAVFLRAFLREQYAQTQKFFKDKGIKNLTIYRGMRYNNTDGMGALRAEDGQIEKHNSAKVQLQPLSSFSLDPKTAAGFSGGQVGALIATTVPVGRIFATPKTGIGCLNEFELVLLSGDSHQNAAAGVSWNNLQGTYGTVKDLPVGDRVDMMKVLLEELETKKGTKKNATKALAKSIKK